MSQQQDLSLGQRLIKQGSHHLIELAADIVAKNPVFKKFIAKFDPSGKIVAEIFRYGAGAINLKNPLMEDIIHAAGGELATAMGKWGPDATDEEKKKAQIEGLSKANAVVQKKVEDIRAMKVRTIGNLFVLSGCDHLPKPHSGGKNPTPIEYKTVAEALDQGYHPSSCGCFGKYALDAQAPGSMDAKTDGKTMTDANPKSPLPQAVIIENTIGEYLQQFMTEAPPGYKAIVAKIRELTADDPVMATKFHDLAAAEDYERFKFVILQPFSEWKMWLDSFDRKKAEPKGGVKKFLRDTFGEVGSRERKETDAMIDGAGDILDKAKAKLETFDEKVESWAEKRQAKREERRAKREAPPRGKLGPIRKIAGLMALPAMILVTYIILSNL